MNELRILGVVGARRCERALAVNAPERSRECRGVSSESACARTGARIMYVTVTPFRVLSSLSLSLPSLVVLSRHLSLSRSSPFFPPPPSFTPSLRFPVLRFPSSLFVSPSRSAVSPVGADTLTFPHHPEERSIPHQSEARSRAPVVGPATTSCVYPTLSLPTSVCAPAACSPLQHIGWNTHARTPPPPPPPPWPAARTRSFRGK